MINSKVRKKVIIFLKFNNSASHTKIQLSTGENGSINRVFELRIEVDEA
jgi:hypothetical protein